MKIIAKPIDVLAVFKAGKKPQPCRIKIIENEELLEIPIEKISNMELSNLAGIPCIIYCCQGGGRLFDLKYIINKCEWQLYRI